MSPFCPGTNGCKLGKPHEIASEKVLKGKSRSILMQVVAGKMKVIKADCGGRATLGKRAALYAKRLLKPQIVSAAPNSLGQLIKQFDEIFLSRMDPKAPGTYLQEGGHLVAFASVGSDGRILTREIFSPDMKPDEEASIMEFIKKRIPEAHFQTDQNKVESSPAPVTGK